MKRLSIIKRNKKVKTITGGLVLGIAAVPAVLCGAGYDAHADFVDTVTATLEVSCNMASEISQGNEHTATIEGGSGLKSDIGSTDITITCNDTGGWGVFAVGYSDDTEGNTDMISRSGSTTNTIATGTAISGDVSNWAMKVTPGEGAQTANSFSSYKSVPANYTRVLENAANVRLGSIGKANTTYRVFVAGAQPAGTYTSKVHYVLVNPGTKSCPDGYELKDGTCQEKKLLMQDVAEWGSTLAVGDSIQAVDSRDDKTYWVTRLADGNIWMTQNLDLNIDSTKTYTPADTDISANWTPTSSTYATGSTSWDWSYTTPESYDPGNLCWNGTLDTSWGGNLGNRTEPCSEGSHYQIGNYYNWTAAVAMNDSSSHSTSYEDVNQSICPAGWRLPTYSGDKSYANLFSETGNVTSGTSGNIHTSPLYFVYGGGWSGSSTNVGSFCYYWSSVVSNDDESYRLNFDINGRLAPQYGDDRGYGGSVRCVAR